MAGKYLYKLATKKFPGVEIRVLADNDKEAIELAKDAIVVMAVDQAFGDFNPKIHPVYYYEKRPIQCVTDQPKNPRASTASLF